LGQVDGYAIVPEFRIKTKDTNHTAIRVINYFDQSSYQNLYLNQFRDSTNYIANLKTDTLGYADASLREGQIVDLYIDDRIKIPALNIEKGKLNTIEIMNSEGFLHLKYKQGNSRESKTALIIQRGTTDSLLRSIPSIIKLKPALYDVYTEDVVENKYSFYIKPAHLYTYYANESFKLIIENISKVRDISIYYYHRKSKEYIECRLGDKLMHSEILLPSNCTYRIDYKKKNSKKLHSRYLKARRGEAVYKIALE